MLNWRLSSLTLAGLLGVALSHGVARPQDGSETRVVIRGEAELPPGVSGRAFRKSLETPVAGVAWHGMALRRVLRDTGELTGIAFVRDRRLDPAQPVEFVATNQSRQEMLGALAKAVGVEERVVGNVVYWGPAEAARGLRTLIALREQELTQFVRPEVRAARERLKVRREVRWGDLTTPREVLERVGDGFRLRVLNPELIPHDLWEGAVLPQLTAAEMLSVVLVQFDLTFMWADDLEAIRLVPIATESLAIERTHRVPAARREMLETWRESHGAVRVQEVKPGEYLVRGLVEEQEQLAELLEKGEGAGAAAATTPAMVVPIERRRFTLSITGVPAEAVMRELEKSGIEFEFDAKTFADAGVDFKTAVSLEQMNAPPQEFFRALFEPLGLEFAISGAKVALRLKE